MRIPCKVRKAVEGLAVNLQNGVSMHGGLSAKDSSVRMLDLLGVSIGVTLTCLPGHIVEIEGYFPRSSALCGQIYAKHTVKSDTY